MEMRGALTRPKTRTVWNDPTADVKSTGYFETLRMMYRPSRRKAAHVFQETRSDEGCVGTGMASSPPLYSVHVHLPRLTRSYICLSRGSEKGRIIGKAWDEMWMRGDGWGGESGV